MPRSCTLNDMNAAFMHLIVVLTVPE